MKKDIILCGVGGQGILSIATVIGEAATKAGLNLKQAEVHGMSQRGGDVQSNLRLSNEPIWSDLIPQGAADIIISMEPMEALRYVPYLHKGSQIITASKPFVNIPKYPEESVIKAELESFPNVSILDVEELAQKAGSARSTNMVLLGAAAKHMELLSIDQILNAVEVIFKAKGPEVVELNKKAVKLGYESQN